MVTTSVVLDTGTEEAMGVMDSNMKTTMVMTMKFWLLQLWWR